MKYSHEPLITFTVPPMSGPSGGKPPLVSSQSHHQASAASGLMLWKKVQHYVVVGGAFANAPHAAAAAAASSVPLKGMPNILVSKNSISCISSGPKWEIYHFNYSFFPS